MKTRLLIATLSFALAAERLAAQDQTKALQEWANRQFSPPEWQGRFDIFGTGGSRSRVLSDAVEAGAIYELKLRLPWEKVDQYVSDYARWFLPVDQLPCAPGGTCESNGRRLITVMTRELGDHYNLVFVYRYESAYKEDYYCKFSKAFFRYHLGEATVDSDFDANFATVRHEQGLPGTFDARTVLRNLPQECAKAPDATQRAALKLAGDTLHKFDMALAAMVESDEGSWNFDINACKVLKWRQAHPGGTVDKSKITAKKLEDDCPTPSQSWLQRAVREWKSQ